MAEIRLPKTMCPQAKNVLAGQASEWALFRKHPSEARPGHLFGVQVCAARRLPCRALRSAPELRAVCAPTGLRCAYLSGARCAHQQVCGAHIDMMARVAQSIEDTVDVDFVDVHARAEALSRIHPRDR